MQALSIAGVAEFADNASEEPVVEEKQYQEFKKMNIECREFSVMI